MTWGSVIRQNFRIHADNGRRNAELAAGFDDLSKNNSATKTTRIVHLPLKTLIKVVHAEFALIDYA